ncbi:protein of unknown function [Ruminococcaceae bacterium YRB3002]|nr:protein of unknown function [Ruminococcaceae bacterium YRB3002]
MSDRFEYSRNFYNEHVAGMIRTKFPEYEDRIAVGIAGEGSDCFGYDDFMSRDHDFGTGVCLWVTSGDMERFGRLLSIAYNELIDSMPGNNLTERLRARRGVMTVDGFYSSILGIGCDASACALSEEQWMALDHSCLATAVNGEVWRDDVGEFTAFREMLLGYYPDSIWRRRIADELHRFSAALQVNYARCMTRDDVVAAEMCRLQGLDSAMQLYFLMKREYPPYYKWTYRRLTEIDESGRFASLVARLSQCGINREAWAGKEYSGEYRNLTDQTVFLTEEIALYIVGMMRDLGLTDNNAPYLEKHVDEMRLERTSCDDSNRSSALRLCGTLIT